jgi:hypothetical protein
MIFNKEVCSFCVSRIKEIETEVFILLFQKKSKKKFVNSLALSSISQMAGKFSFAVRREYGLRLKTLNSTICLRTIESRKKKAMSCVMLAS